MMSDGAFFDLYRHGFVRAAVAVPEVRVANPRFNAEQSAALMQAAAGKGACLVAFPELGLTGYTCEDLFHQQALLDAAEQALQSLLEQSQRHPVLAILGMPLAVDG